MNEGDGELTLAYRSREGGSPKGDSGGISSREREEGGEEQKKKNHPQGLNLPGNGEEGEV